MKKCFNGFAYLLVLALGLMIASPSAYGAASLRFVYDGGAPITCADGAACDINPLAGVVTYSASIGTFLVNVTTGVSKPVFAQPQMDLNSINVQSGAGAHTLVMSFSDDNFSVPSPGFTLDFGGTLTFPAGSTIQANGYLDNGNTLFAQTTALGQIGPFGPGAFAGSTSGPGTADTSYSLTQVLTLTTSGPGSFSGDFALNPVPEPASVALFGGLLLFTGAAIRRKVKRA